MKSRKGKIILSIFPAVLLLYAALNALALFEGSVPASLWPWVDYWATVGQSSWIGALAFLSLLFMVFYVFGDSSPNRK